MEKVNYQSKQSVEQAIVSKGLGAPRLRPADIDQLIVGESYHRFENTTVTVCCLTLKNGFNVTGESACISADNFNDEIGRGIARANARDKIWQLAAYSMMAKN